jgi:prepilin-type N-terminal cleavage/methylation domain-containing protein
MIHDPGRARRRRPGGAAPRGHTLIEAIVVLAIMGVLATFGIPRFHLALEQSRANVAGAGLRSIWSAQRLYWLDNRTYASDLPTLQATNLIDPSLATTTAPYTYQMTTASDGSSFTATATRSGTTSWTGTFSIDSSGNLTGQVQSGEGTIAATSLP